MIQLIQASAHHLPMIETGSVHVLVTSPPYFSLRRYEGVQDIEWPTVEYAPMAGLPPIRVQGCEPGCSHEWDTLPPTNGRGGQSDFGSSTLKMDGRPEESRIRTLTENAKELRREAPTTQGAYCRHCGGWRGPLGLETEISSYIGHLVLCLREWWRILRADACAFVNLGDSYATNPGNGRGGGEKVDGGIPHYSARDKTKSGLKPKNLMLVPARFALAAQAEGWIVRADIIGAKTAPMPESVTDRPTRSHEHIFLLAKQPRYYYDAEAVRERATADNREYFRGNDKYTGGNSFDNGAEKPAQGKGHVMNAAGTRNLRDVITWSPSPFPGSHFATFPSRIPEIAILAGTSAVGCCAKCGSGWVRVVLQPDMSERPTRSEQSKYPSNDTAMNGIHINDHWKGTRKSAGQAYQQWRNANPDVTTGWQPGCECDAGEPVPAVVCDPFHGSGTTGKVALRLGRSYLGVDLSRQYLDDITAQRLGDGVQMEICL